MSSSLSKVAKSSAKMATATLLSRILGLVREQVLAFMFGATGTTDAFLVAYRIPNMLRDLFAEGAFSSAFVPIFTKFKLENEERAKELLWSTFLLLSFATSLVSLVVIVFAPEIVNLMAPEYIKNPEIYSLTVLLTRIMAPFLTLISMAALFMGVLNTLKIFFVPALAPALFNVVMILCMLLTPHILTPRGIHPAIGIGIGVILGGFAQMLIQIPLLLKNRYGFIKPKKIINRGTLSIINRMGVGVVGIAATEINLLVNTILATSTVVGAVSWLTYAFRLFQFPVGILGVSIAGSNLVHFSEAWKSGNVEEAKNCLKGSYDLTLFLMLPAMAIMSALAFPSTHLIFEHGRFTPIDTLNTSTLLVIYLLGLPFYGFYKIFTPTFYALDCPRIPVIISIISVSLNILFCVLLVPHYGYTFLALGTTLSMVVNSLVQGVLLSRKMNLSYKDFFHVRLCKLLLISALTFSFTYFMLPIFFSVTLPWYVKLTSFTLLFFIAVLLHLLLALLLGEGNFLKPIWRKILKKG